MKCCIYCLRDETKTSFESREHVISEFLGTFEPLLVFENDYVCKECNNITLSEVENIFAEDSVEGFYLSSADFKRKKTVRIRGERTKVIIKSEDKSLGIFENIFPNIDLSKATIRPRPHVVFRKEDSSMSVLYVDEIDKLKVGGYKHRRITDWLKTINKSNINIFGNKEFPLKKIIKILKNLGVSYNEKKQQPFGEECADKKVAISVSTNMDDTLKRFPCKLAFNYFAYCMVKSGYAKLLYNSNFDDIRNFIYKGQRLLDGSVPVKPVSEPTLFNEIDAKNRTIAHQVSFLSRNNIIIAKTTILGIGDYEVCIGSFPFKMIKESDFGCGHLFDPVNNNILPLYSSTTPCVGRPNFSVIKK